jgi:hypothetical protein
MTIALGAIMAIGVSLGFAACDGGANSSSSSGKLVSADLREGYKVQYDGFYGSVHWITNQTTGNKIYGRLFLPDDFSESKQYPTLIMSHGYNALSEDGTSKVVQNAVAQGMIVYTYDFCGGGRLSKSDGKTTDMTVNTEISDLEYVMSDMQGKAYVDNDKLTLSGRSFGGLVTALTAAKHNNEVAAMILFFPAFSCGNFRVEGCETADDVPDTFTYNYLTIGKGFAKALWDLDPYEVITGYTKNLLILHGDADTSVPVEYSYRAVEAYGEDKAKLHVVAGAEHNFTDENYAEIMPDFNEYLQSMGII